jgi:hypothetical protein
MASTFGERGGNIETIRAPRRDQCRHYTHAERERRHRPFLGAKSAGARRERRRRRQPNANVRGKTVRQCKPEDETECTQQQTLDHQHGDNGGARRAQRAHDGDVVPALVECLRQRDE